MATNAPNDPSVIGTGLIRRGFLIGAGLAAVLASMGCGGQRDPDPAEVTRYLDAITANELTARNAAIASVQKHERETAKAAAERIERAPEAQ